METDVIGMNGPGLISSALVWEERQVLLLKQSMESEDLGFVQDSPTDFLHDFKLPSLNLSLPHSSFI